MLDLPDYEGLETADFANQISNRIDQKDYPYNDPSLGEDLTALIVALEELDHPDLMEVEEDMNNVFSVIEDIRDGEKEMEDMDANEITYALSIELWNNAVMVPYSKDEPLRGGDLYNLYSEVQNSQLSVRYLHLFKENYFKRMIESAKFNSDRVEEIKNTEFSDEESWNKRLLFCGMIFTAWNKYNKVIIPESRMEAPDSN